MKIRVEYEDGRHWAVRYSYGHEAAAMKYVEMTGDEWAAYQTHRVMDKMWQRRLLDLGNEQYELEHPPEKPCDTE